MKRIDSLGYPIVIDQDCREHAAAFAAARKARRIVILSDVAVAAVAKRFAKALRGEARVTVETFALGERRKTLHGAGRVLRRLARAGADRSTLVIGVGGGVASDLFGFAAATYMRGVAYATVSTTLVGMADAAIGGKTGVDLPQGKNLAGVFRDPVAVFCDLTSLSTLAPSQLREGLAEVVKAAIISGEEPFAALEGLAALPLRSWPWEQVVTRAIETKCDLVLRDREEHGVREVLNLGHTFGHAIEHVSGYRVTHGSAVAAGLCAAGLLAIETGRFSQAEHDRVVSLLTALRLPAGYAGFKAGALLRAMRFDKKARNGELRFVLPKALGDIEFGVTVEEDLVRDVLTRLSTRSRSRRAS